MAQVSVPAVSLAMESLPVLGTLTRCQSNQSLLQWEKVKGLIRQQAQGYNDRGVGEGSNILVIH